MYSEKERDKILELAEKYVKKGKLKEAIGEYQKLLTGNAQDSNIRSLVGDLYVESGQKKRAITEFKKVADFYEKRGQYNQSLAIYKKINRLDADDMATAMKLADLYYNQGFVSEAKTKYLQIANNLKKNGQTKEAISFYEKVLKLDKRAYEAKLTLANLYSKEGLIDKAVEEFNEVAEFKIKNKDFKKAAEILNQAKILKEGDLRTLSNLIEVLKRENKKEKALELINDVLKRDENNLEALSLLGNLYFEEQNFNKAEEIFRKIISLRPKDVEVRFKLGRLFILERRLDEAFEIYEPLVDSLLRKQNEEKAVGLLGLILATKKPHLPTLEKLAFIYKANNQIKELEIAYRAILEECRRKNLKEKSLLILKEIMTLSPLDEEAYKEYSKLKKELGIKEEEISKEPTVFVDEAKEIIKRNLAKADLYIKQGLIRNARRILENLRIKFPEEPIIEQKIVALNQISSQVKEEEIAERVEKVTERETQIFGKGFEKHQRMHSYFPEEGEEKLTAADIFAETDIIPVIYQEEKERKYYDLKEKIDEELEIIRAIYNRQLKGDTAVVEKELSEIVSQFKKGIEAKIKKEDYESRFNLGVAYLEQRLIDEAIAEFKLASKDERRAIDCYSVLSYCYKKKRDFHQALKWLEKAIDTSKKGSSQFFGLNYEMASLYEEMKEKKKALTLYNEIKKWNAKYRDVTDRIEELRKKPSK